MNIVILAGGGGTRLWPLSRKLSPKQFQRLIGDRTLVEETRRRCSHLPDAAVYYSVTKDLVPALRELFPNVADGHLIVEPEKRDTGPAMGYAAAVLGLTAPDEPMAFLPSDHYIRDVKKFRTALDVAEGLIRETGCLVDIGVTASWPNTNLGYTKVGQRKEVRNGVEVYPFKGHTEKPTAERAEAFLASGEYLWHANYYMWTPAKFLAAYEQHAPANYAHLREIQELIRSGRSSAIPAAYAKLEKISIDYAITEKLEPADVLILKAPFDWSDVGTWDVLKKLEGSSPSANVVHDAEHVGIDTSDTLVYGPKGKVIATLGIDHLVIVETDDALLIADRRRDQEVKKVVEELERRGQSGIL
ncbi:MAG: mannose-1-phosphate guanylyltransferase [Candidatus Kerfeldbacteria bacterium]|nr:mannose-1-phosphate guanylyltransferase [Candidatus Kerfeldbacteria bacterium]